MIGIIINLVKKPKDSKKRCSLIQDVYTLYPLTYIPKKGEGEGWQPSEVNNMHHSSLSLFPRVHHLIILANPDLRLSFIDQMFDECFTGIRYLKLTEPARVP